MRLSYKHTQDSILWTPDVARCSLLHPLGHLIVPRRKLLGQAFHALGFLLLHKNIQILIIVKYKHTVHFTACLNSSGPHVVIWLRKMSKPLLNHQCMGMYICHTTHSKKCLTSSMRHLFYMPFSLYASRRRTNV